MLWGSMQPMVIDHTRRKLLRAALSGLAVMPFAGLGGCSDESRAGKSLGLTSASEPMADAKIAHIIGCSRQGEGQFGVVAAALDGQPLYQVPLPARGHGVAVQPGGSLAAAFGRRPGTYLQVFDYKNGTRWPIYMADAGRHFYGHGVFSPDGKLIYATEGKSQTSQGVIGVYEVQPAEQGGRLTKVAEFSGFGIGPHEVVLADSETLAIGVGGVHTHGREPLNLDTMQPALVYLNRYTGEMVDKAELPDKHLSIRHLSVTDTGAIACGQQYRGKPEDAVPLVALHRRGQALQHLVAEEAEWLRFNHYIASIASLDGYLLATSPRGNCYGIWDETSGKLVEQRPLVDASGVGIKDGQWLVGSGSGRIVAMDTSFAAKTVQSPVMWDNHWNII